MRGRRRRTQTHFGTRPRERRPLDKLGPFERLALVAASLAFIAVFVVTYLHGREAQDVRVPPQVEVQQRVVQVPAQQPSIDRPVASAPSGLQLPVSAEDAAVLETETVTDARFTFCHSGGGTNCVVDGDTVWIDGEKIRVADIDAPETHPSRCAAEADLGHRATQRLAEIMNAGPFELEVLEQDTDLYGRKLRVIIRNGRSLGGQLVSEGLARRWDGRRRSWC